MSRPSRARGLKLDAGQGMAVRGTVAPLAGAWIETLIKHRLKFDREVAPLAGAWIETKENNHGF